MSYCFIKIPIGLLIIIALCSCEKAEIRDLEDYNRWVNQKENGFVKRKKANQVELTLKHLPASYLAMKEFEEEAYPDSPYIKDSLLEAHEGALTFLLSLTPSEESNESDLMYRNVSGYKDYKKRFLQLNFGIKKYIKLKIGDKSYRPVLSSLENTYGMQRGRNIIMVFVPQEKSDKTFYRGETIDVVFDDRLYKTGINHFVFSRDELENIPPIINWNNT